MRALLQRVTCASVAIDENLTGSIGLGLVVFIGISQEDTQADSHYVVNKTTNLRIFSDEDGKFQNSALDTKAELLVVSQFTLYGDTRKGRRPSFTNAAEPEIAKSLFEHTLQLFKETDLRVETGRFQANMEVSIVNDGPVTIMLDSADRQRPGRN